MKKTKTFLLSLLCIWLHLQAIGQTRQPIDQVVGMKVNLQHLKNETTRYVMKNRQGEKQGNFTHHSKRTGQIVSFQNTYHRDANRSIHYLVTMNTNLVELTGMTVKGKGMKTRIKGKLAANGNQIKSSFTLTHRGESKTMQVDTTINSWVVLPLLTNLMPHMELEPGFERNVNVFDPAKLKLDKWNLKVLKDEVEVQVPAGKFKVQKVILNSPTPWYVSNIFYISKTYPNKIVRIDEIETGWTMEMLK